MSGKLRIFTLLLLFLIIGSAFAQPLDIMKIRELYSEAQTQIKEQQDGDLPLDFYHLMIEQNLPGIGPQTMDLKFYFYLSYDENEESGEGDYSQKVYLVQRSYNVAASLNIYEEFLFYDDGICFFFRKTEGYECGEERFYFDENQKILKLKLNPANNCADAQTVYPDYTTENEPENEYKDWIKRVLADSEQVFQLFLSIKKQAIGE